MSMGSYAGGGAGQWRECPSAMAWESIRPAVEDLYIRQALSLRDVKVELEKQGFYATERMFKTRIKNWRLSKNNKEESMLAILSLSRSRERQGKPSQFFVGGKQIILEDVVRYYDRKGADANSLEQVNHVGIPRDVSCVTPPLVSQSVADERATNSNRAPLPHARSANTASQYGVSTPSLLSRQEFGTLTAEISPLAIDKASRNLVASTRAYYSTKFRPGIWVLGTVDLDIHKLYPSMRFGSLFLRYHNLRLMKDHRAATSTLESAFGMVKGLLEVEDPRLLTYLLESIAYSRMIGYDEVAHQLIVFFTKMSIIVHGPRYPLSIIGGALLQREAGTRAGVVDIALTCMIDQFIENIGAKHVETMRLLLTAAEIFKHQKSYPSALEYLEMLLDLYNQVYGFSSYQASHALVNQAYIAIEIGDYNTASGLMDQATSRADGITDANEKVESNVRCLVGLAKVREMQGMLLEAVSTLEQALEVGIPLTDSHWMMIDVKASLSTLLDK